MPGVPFIRNGRTREPLRVEGQTGESGEGGRTSTRNREGRAFKRLAALLTSGTLKLDAADWAKYTNIQPK